MIKYIWLSNYKLTTEVIRLSYQKPILNKLDLALTSGWVGLYDGIFNTNDKDVCSWGGWGWEGTGGICCLLFVGCHVDTLICMKASWSQGHGRIPHRGELVLL